MTVFMNVCNNNKINGYDNSIWFSLRLSRCVCCGLMLWVTLFSCEKKMLKSQKCKKKYIEICMYVQEWDFYFCVIFYGLEAYWNSMAIASIYSEECPLYKYLC